MSTKLTTIPMELLSSTPRSSAFASSGYTTPSPPISGQMHYPDGRIVPIEYISSPRISFMSPSEIAVRRELHALHARFAQTKLDLIQAQSQLSQAVQANQVMHLQLHAYQQMLHASQAEAEQLKIKLQKRKKYKEFIPLKSIPEKSEEKFHAQFQQTRHVKETITQKIEYSRK